MSISPLLLCGHMLYPRVTLMMKGAVVMCKSMLCAFCCLPAAGIVKGKWHMAMTYKPLLALARYIGEYNTVIFM